MMDFFLTFAGTLALCVLLDWYKIIPREKSPLVFTLILNAGIVFRDLLSVGKRRMGLILITEEGRKAKLYQRLFRNLLIGPFILIDFCLIISNQPRLLDRLFKTKVVLK